MAKDKTTVKFTDAEIESFEQALALPVIEKKVVEDLKDGNTLAIEDFDMAIAVTQKLKDTTIKSGVMPRKYYKIYQSQGGNNGDVFAVALRDAFMTKDQFGNEHFDASGFKSWATKAGFWHDKYDGLNPGMQRMNAGNRARSAIRNGLTVELNGVAYSKTDIKPVK